jgi:hypothetical protein
VADATRQALIGIHDIDTHGIDTHGIDTHGIRTRREHLP